MPAQRFGVASTVFSKAVSAGVKHAAVRTLPLRLQTHTHASCSSVPSRIATGSALRCSHHPLPGNGEREGLRDDGRSHVSPSAPTDTHLVAAVTPIPGSMPALTSRPVGIEYRAGAKIQTRSRCPCIPRTRSSTTGSAGRQEHECDRQRSRVRDA